MSDVSPRVRYEVEQSLHGFAVFATRAAEKAKAQGDPAAAAEFEEKARHWTRLGESVGYGLLEYLHDGAFTGGKDQ